MDFTHLIERLEAFEERSGVHLEALSAIRKSGSEYVKLRGELHPMQGTSIQRNIELVADIYDGPGRLIDHNTRSFSAEGFYGFETFEIWVCGNIPDSDIAKLRLYPRQ